MESTVCRHVAVGVAVAVALSATVIAQSSPQSTPPTPTAQRASAAPQAPGTNPDEWTQWVSGRYRLTPGDALALTFPYVPELDQTVTVQPDGYVTLKELPDMRVQGRTLTQLKADLVEAYGAFVRDPVINVALTEFEKPYFMATGEVAKPGRYELRGATTVTQALAVAGGPTEWGNMSRVVLYRRFAENGLDVTQVNVSRMYARKDLAEDPILRPGDTVVVPKSVVGKLSPLRHFTRWLLWF